MATSEYQLTPAENRFRIWMWLSFFMYAVGVPFFLFLGRTLTAVLIELPHLYAFTSPWDISWRYEVPFWQVLGVSLMAILAVLCWHIARDVRRYGPMIKALLAAKLTSTLCYGAFFASDPNGAYFVGALTDGSIFVISLVLWYLAAPANRYLDEYETRVLVAVGETLLPQGGAYPKGYRDEQERCLNEARRLLAAQSSLDVVLTRLMLRVVNILPWVLGYFGRFHTLGAPARQAFFEGIEQCRFGPVRIMALGVKLYAVTPFFNEPDKVLENPDGKI